MRLALRITAVFTILLILASCQAPAPQSPVTAEPAMGQTAVSTAPTTTASPTIVPPTPTPQPTGTAVPPTPTPTPTESPSPTPSPAAASRVEDATLPPGFTMTIFAEVYRPTGLAFDQNGRLLVTSFDGSVRLFTDTTGDGRADRETVFADGFNTPLGVTLRPGTSDVYISSKGHITILRDETGDERADSRIDFVTDLPTGLHQNDNLKFGPDGQLYIGVGSTCDVCVEEDPRSATIMRFDPQTGAGEIIATGLRNPYDLAFHPLTGDLFATDNGRDDLGLDAPQEELNHIIPGGDYGWPGCWDNLQGPDCAGTTPAIAFFEPRASANSIDFYADGPFPTAYHNNAFVAVFGSFAKRTAQSGVARVVLTPDGSVYTSEVSWFARWPRAMPLGLIIGPDGALYVGDYLNGFVYRIIYQH